MIFKDKHKHKGFSLAELTILVIVIGTMAGLALPRLGVVINRGKNMEGENILYAIFTSQQDLFRETGAYTNNIANLDVTMPASGLQSFGNPVILAGSAGCSVNLLGRVSSNFNRPTYDLVIDTAGVLHCISGGSCPSAYCRKMGY